ncbi:MAG: hypothetical protein SFV19_08135 [Rhodospirillaceae bacterium]|nr:hypothetical protein [Rhodospirillaceae bacterium]
MTDVLYPIDIVEEEPGKFRASWADFPTIASGLHADAQSALKALVDMSLDQVAEVVAKGTYPAPSPANHRPVVSFGAAIRPEMTYLANIIGISRAATTTYCWTNNIAYFE